MPEYVLPSADAPAFQELDAFTQGYIEALFFTETEPGTTRKDQMTTRGTVRKSWAARAYEGQQKDMPGDYGPDDLAPRALERIKADCAAFQAAHAVDLEQAYSETDYSPEQAGRDLWFTRNGHGVGFWDRDALDWFAASDNGRKLQDTLSDGARALGSRDAYVGDDGKVYV